MNRKLFIFGLGHLATKVISFNDRYTIHGTFRHQKPTHLNIEKYMEFSLGDEILNIEEYDRILVNFPPQAQLLPFLEKLNQRVQSNQEVIFISSTSVYGEGECDENSSLNGSPRSGDYLIKCEQFLKDKNWIVIRPGGLVDEKRNPANFFKNTSDIKDAQNHINYIHTGDLARFILKEQFKAKLYNLVAPKRYTKEAFYKKLYAKDEEKNYLNTEKKDRIIISKEKEVLHFEFLYPDLLEYFIQL